MFVSAPIIAARNSKRLLSVRKWTVKCTFFHYFPPCWGASCWLWQLDGDSLADAAALQEKKRGHAASVAEISPKRSINAGGRSATGVEYNAPKKKILRGCNYGSRVTAALQMAVKRYKRGALFSHFVENAVSHAAGLNLWRLWSQRCIQKWIKWRGKGGNSAKLTSSFVLYLFELGK